ncbi:MAG: 3-methyl-2-oxobutanoate hydroxymethyltransferase [Rhodospirillales bacterium]|nr:3-methyl-2-oxobutanoate hydroxymethyltransferase [Rhodospirillales bacterium]
MSAHGRGKALSVRDIRGRKGGDPLVCLTAYGAGMARLIDPHVDLILVGDSLGMVLYGEANTLAVPLERMIAHGAAVARAAARACVIVDLPFGSYQESPRQAFRNAARVMAETGCAGVKLEGGRTMAETVAFLTARGVPVLGHVGLMPQMVNTVGGFRTQGRDPAEGAAILDDAAAIAEAGAFALVVEATAEPVARRVTEEVAVPTIGIGASPACDGQILVTEDILGLTGAAAPSFVKRYAELGAEIDRAAAAYAEEVRARRFPGPEHCVAGPPRAKPRRVV